MFKDLSINMGSTRRIFAKFDTANISFEIGHSYYVIRTYNDLIDTCYRYKTLK